MTGLKQQHHYRHQQQQNKNNNNNKYFSPITDPILTKPEIITITTETTSTTITTTTTIFLGCDSIELNLVFIRNCGNFDDKVHNESLKKLKVMQKIVLTL